MMLEYSDLGMGKNGEELGRRFPFWKKVKVLVVSPAICDPMDCSPPGSSVHGILQARILALPESD